MDAQKFLGSLTNLSDILARAPHLFYAMRRTVSGVPQITFAFATPPSTHVDFESEAKCDLWWNEFVGIMTEMCTPACVVIGKTLFQPRYLLRVVSYSKEQMHFIVLDFGNNRNLAFGFRAKERQTSFCALLLRALPPGFKIHNQPPP